MPARIRSMLLCASLVLTVAACGGGGDDDDDDDDVPVGPGWSTPPAPPATPTAGATVDGIFRDAVVEGLDFSDGGALAGTTSANGRFQYAQDNAVTFRIGGLTLGSLVGQPFMTPMHLIGTGTPSVSIAINNRLRLLQMLDQDSNPENGILISNAVRAVATNWTTPDFNLAYPAFAAAIEPLRLAANAADGVSTHTVPTETAASAHFIRTFWCTYSGLYRGTFTGAGDNGVWSMVVYGQGLMFGGGYSSVDRAGFGLEASNSGGAGLFPVFIAPQSNTVRFSGSFRSPNSILGNWTNAPDTGTFVGGRSGGSDSARYRINGYQFPLGTALLVALEVDASNQVTGQIVDRDYLRTGEPVTLTGTLNGTALTAAASGNVYTLSATFNTSNPASLTFSGTLRDNVKARDVNLNSLQACRLN